jgi:hypothetical protein
LAELEERGFGWDLGYRPSSLGEFLLAPIHPPSGRLLWSFRHSVDQNNDKSCNLVLIHPWKLFFDGSACREGQSVGVVLISSRGVIFEQSVHLEYFCTNNQAEYEAILLSL